MKTIEYRTIDKSQWGPGPWQDEPDKVQFPDPETGLPCLIVRNRFGALCGYVGVPPGHRLHGHSYNRVDLRVHGVLTFAANYESDRQSLYGGNHRRGGFNQPFSSYGMIFPVTPAWS